MIGAGSWGSALAIQLADNSREVNLYCRNKKCFKEIQDNRTNSRYLPNIIFPENINIFSNIEDSIRNANTLIIALPSETIRDTFLQLKNIINSKTGISWASKGLEVKSGLLIHSVCEEILGKKYPMAVISGPSFAVEVANKKPTAVTIASSSRSFRNQIARDLSSRNFRVYTSDDVIGSEIGGAIKNIIAIGAGISDGLNYGENAKIALITRGLHEIQKLGVALGAKKETFSGLSGAGDLFLTCTSNLSRNRRLGLALADGSSFSEFESKTLQVVEGLKASEAVHKLSKKMSISMPICEIIYQILFHQLDPKKAANMLMSRDLQDE